ncbi:enoyl-CoA hydratase [Ammoniphilus sp. 3BR4]|uniref:enoyl-CoA hydratase n=1 Tax=Ammoniphilus sp. 3BR4 TaxID=3158265 RepID=UPI003465DADC
MKPRDPGCVKLERRGAVALLALSRPSALNAITWEMYEQFEQHLAELADDPQVRVLVIRGDGDKALAAGTDISQFVGFTGSDGVQYEHRIDRITQKLIDFPKPTIAAVHGYAVGGGMMITTNCDLRYATPKAKFGAPMARTLGNCLSLNNYNRLVQELGAMRTKELLFTSRLITAEEAMSLGFLTGIFDESEFFPKVMEIAEQIGEKAPLTIQATKEALRLLQLPGQKAMKEQGFDEVVAKVYGSRDFAEGVQAHLEKRPAIWRGE